MKDRLPNVSFITFCLILMTVASAVFFSSKDIHIYIVGMLLSLQLDKLILKDKANEKTD